MTDVLIRRAHRRPELISSATRDVGGYGKQHLPKDVLAMLFRYQHFLHTCRKEKGTHQTLSPSQKTCQLAFFHGGRDRGRGTFYMGFCGGYYGWQVHRHRQEGREACGRTLTMSRGLPIMIPAAPEVYYCMYMAVSKRCIEA